MSTDAKVVLVTGASSGIGFAVSVALAKRGVHVVGVARRAERLQGLTDACASLPGNFLGVAGDVSRPEDMQKAAQAALDHFGRLDALIANAGLGHRGGLVDAEWHDLETLMRTNMDGVIHAIRAAVPAMKNGGRIVIISSVVHNMISPYAALYAASKAFVSSLARALDYELAPRGVRVCDVLLGRTQTEFNERRLGAGSRKKSRVPEMTADYVAEKITDLTLGRFRRRAALRWFDRLILIGNALIPHFIAGLASKQYK